MEFQKVLDTRYSCRKYKQEQVSEADLKAILEAGRIAPTAKNFQEQKIYVLQSEESFKKVDALTPCRFGAPTVLMVAYDKTNVFTYPGGKYESGAEDAAIVATYMMLAAKNAGVDSCWVNYFDPDKMAESFGLPENERILLLLPIGYAAEDAKPLASMHFSRKELSETVKYL